MGAEEREMATTHPHRRARLVALALIVALGVPDAAVTLQAQSAQSASQTPEAALADARRLTDALEYEKALAVLDALLPRTEKLAGAAGRSLRVAALELRGRVRFALGTQGAADDFRQLLSLSPGHSLPPQVSPRIVELFEDIKRGDRGTASNRTAPAAASSSAARPASASSTSAPPTASTRSASAKPKPAEPPPPPPVVLSDGTRITVRLLEEVSSSRASEGDILAFEVMEDVVVDGQLLITQGTPARGTVVQAQARRRMGRAGRLSYAVTETRAHDNRVVRLRATREGSGGSAVGSTAAATAGVALLVPVAAPFVLLRRGKDVTVPVGTRIDAFVDGDHRFP